MAVIFLLFGGNCAMDTTDRWISLTNSDGGYEIRSSKFSDKSTKLSFTDAYAHHQALEVINGQLSDPAIKAPAALSLLEKHQRSNPWFLLNECSAESCGLTRKMGDNHSYRDQIVQDFTSVLPPLISDLNQGVDLAFFASGGLYFESQLLLSLLKAGLHIRTIHLIDFKYVKVMDNIAIDKHQSTTINLDRLIKPNVSGESLKAQISIAVELMQLSQFQNLLAKNGSTPPIKFYPSGEAFAKSGTMVDILFALDFMEGEGLQIMGAFESLQAIGTKNLRKNALYAFAWSNQQKMVGALVQRHGSEPGIAQPIIEVIFQKSYAKGSTTH